MKIIAIHNYYQNRGGEDQLFEDEAKLLESQGHEIIWHTIHSDSIKDRNLLSVAVETLWNRRSYRELIGLIDEHSPDVIHSVNTFPLYSPSIFYAARKRNVPFVATIRNYRYFCAQAMCFRDGKACEACIGKIPWRAVRHRCYKNNTAGSVVVASMQLLHQRLSSWQKYIDVICLASEFSKGKLIQAGMNESQMIIKPNFVVKDPGFQSGSGGYAAFVGRIADEKGTNTLVDAWRLLSEQGLQIPLKIVGDGPDTDEVKKLVESNPNVEWFGHLPNEEVFRVVGNAACLIFPSTGYESLPKTLIEAMAVGTPVIGSNIGSIPEIVIDENTGYLYPAGDANALASCALKFFDESGTAIENHSMRSSCRKMFEEKFTSSANYDQLLRIYKEAIRRRKNASKLQSTVSDDSVVPSAQPDGPLPDSQT